MGDSNSLGVIGQEMRARDAARRAAALTQREREVLRLLASGTTTRAMADQLGVSAYTVRNHLRNIFTKIHVNSRVQATAFAWRHGLLRECAP